MSKQQETLKSFDPTQLVISAIDNAFIKDLMTSGMTEAQARQEVVESRQIATCYDELMAAGYTDEQIGVLWEGKTPQEILADAKAKQAKPRTSRRQTRKPTVLNKTP